MHTITVLCLGLDEEMTIGMYDKLVRSEKLLARTSSHPVIYKLVADGLVIDTLDYLIQQKGSGSDTAEEKIVSQLIEKASLSPFTYIVPGYPAGEGDIIRELMKRYKNVEILKERNVLDDLIRSVNVDPLGGIQLIHSSNLNRDTIQTGQPVFIMEVCNRLKAEEVKMTLMAKYPADHKVAFIDESGIQPEMVSWLALSEIDCLEGDFMCRTLYSPPLILDEQVTSLSTLQQYLDQVTASDGDVWINEQTPRSLVQYLKEETGELIDAIEKEDTDNWMEELGDVLVQILYQTNAAEKEGFFSFEDVLANVNRKIRRRHPHVFDGVQANTPEEVDAIWQKIKLEEKRMKDEA